MDPRFPSFVPTWHNKSYPAISPTRPELSVKDQTVVVTGGGRGIGPSIAEAFAAAGAKHVALLGRTLETLTATQRRLESQFAGTAFSVHVVDVTDEAALNRAAEQIGTFDVLISNAGFASEPRTLLESDPDDWWQTFEINVKGTYLLARAFYPRRAPGARFISLVSLLSLMEPSSRKTQSSYTASKIAVANVLETLGAEVDDLAIVNVHPGVIATDMLRKGKVEGVERWMDDAELPAHFLVWVASREASFLHGRFVYANWDVEELKAKEQEIKASPQVLTTSLYKYPFDYPGVTWRKVDGIWTTV